MAHTLADKVEAAYRRSDLLEKRRKLMEAWAGFCTATPAGKVVPISGRRRAEEIAELEAMDVRINGETPA